MLIVSASVYFKLITQVSHLSPVFQLRCTLFETIIQSLFWICQINFS
nr:MAG TPA: hypothetical protein [Caudoviricetes sp.]